jgi:large subunit ribosomal protein L28
LYHSRPESELKENKKMAKACEICGRHSSRGRQITRRGLAKKKGGIGRKVTGGCKRNFQANLQRIRVMVNGNTVRMYVCTTCIRSGKIVKPTTKPKAPAPAPAPTPPQAS